MISSSLHLYETDTSSIDCDVPRIIELKECQENGKIILGRGSNMFPVDVVICAKKNGKDIISRHHAEISYCKQKKTFLLKEINALNGLFVNDVRISQHVLIPDDVIQFGGHYNTLPGTVIDNSDISIKYQFRQYKIGATDKKRPRSADNTVVKLEDGLYGNNSSNSSKKLKSTLTTTKAVTKLNIECIPALHSIKSNNGHSIKMESSNNTLKITPNKKINSEAAITATPQTQDSSFCSIDNSSLKAHLTCLLCNDILIDPVILRCSHGYCRSCLESHIRQVYLFCQ